MQELLDAVILENTVKQWLYALGFAAAGFGSGKITALIIAAVPGYICHKTASKIDDIIVVHSRGPLTLLITIGGLALGIGSLTLTEPIKLWTNRFLEAATIVVIIWWLGTVADSFIMHWSPLIRTDGVSKKEIDIQPLLRKFCKTLVWVIGAGLVLKALGYNVSALMAGLGLGGAALALASKDTLANFFGSITVFVDRPFRLNDRIKIVGHDGYITEMGIRTSKLKTLENRTVIIPNSVFAANPIENITAAPHSKISQTLSVKTSLGLEKIQQSLGIVQEIGSTLAGTCEHPSAGLTSIGGNVCQITFTFYIAKDADYTETLNRVNLEILRRFEEAEITLV
ncbi:MAG: mechanosensitive ion channel family protein [Treponema sp.]|jgi:MscS family membrane protein|nr:mechanosensitive ion channel family protein [Treponema sp.]